MTHITFGEVLEALKSGKIAKRSGKPGYLRLIQIWEEHGNPHIIPCSFIGYHYFNAGQKYPCVIPYIPTQFDMMASNWEIENAPVY